MAEVAMKYSPLLFSVTPRKSVKGEPDRRSRYSSVYVSLKYTIIYIYIIYYIRYNKYDIYNLNI